MIKLGTYRHFKGTLYEVLGVITHSETLETLVTYRAKCSPYLNQVNPQNIKVWGRPIDMFNDTVIVNKCKVKRFEYIGG